MNPKISILVKKLYKRNKNATPTDILGKMRHDETYKIIFDKLEPKDLVILCLMIPNVTENTDLKKLYDEIVSKMFVFSIVNIDDRGSLITCKYCGGDGSVRCENCGGESQVDCEDCGGYGEDDEGNLCQTCSGDGQMYCDACDGSGETICDNCNGNGEVINYGFSDITQRFFVSYNTKFLDFLDTKEPMTSDISENVMYEFIDDNKTLVSYISSGSSYEFEEYDEDIILTGVDEDPNVSFFKEKTGLNPNNIADYVR